MSLDAILDARRFQVAGPAVLPKVVSLPDFRIESQKGTYLCWAAAVAMMARYIYGTPLTQCALADDHVHGCDPDCRLAIPSECDQPVVFGTVLAARAAIHKRGKPNPIGKLTSAHIRKTLPGKPIALDFLAGFGRHAEVLYAYLDRGSGKSVKALVVDPVRGSSSEWPLFALDSKAVAYEFI